MATVPRTETGRRRSGRGRVDAPAGTPGAADGAGGNAAISLLSDQQRQAVSNVGARLRRRREEAGLSLRQFARDLGVSASFVSQLENGKSQPSVATLYLICNALELSIDELFSPEEPGAAGGAATGAADPSPKGGRAAVAREEIRGDTEADAGTAAAQHPSVGTGTAGAGRVPGGPEKDRVPERGSDLGSAGQDDRSSAGAPTRRRYSPLMRPGERPVLELDSGVTWESLTSMHEPAVDFMLVRYEVGGCSTRDGRFIRHMGTEYGYVVSGELEVTLGFERYYLRPGDSISFDSSTPHRLTTLGDEPVEAIWFVHGRDASHDH